MVFATSAAMCPGLQTFWQIFLVPGFQVGVSYRDAGSFDARSLASDRRPYHVSVSSMGCVLLMFFAADIGRDSCAFSGLLPHHSQ